MKKEKILRLLKKGLCGIIAAVVVVGGMPAVEAKAARDSYQVDISGTMYRSEVPKFLELLNNERVSRGLEPFVLDDRAMQYAEYRAMETSFLTGHKTLTGDLSYNSSSYTDIGSTVINPGECFLENTQGNTTYSADSMFNTWVNSPGHKAALLNDTKDNLKMGVAFFSTGSQSYTGVWVVLKGKDAVFSEELVNKNDFRAFSVPFSLLNVSGHFGKDTSVVTKGDVIKINPGYRTTTSSGSLWGQHYMNSSCGTWISNDPDKVSIDANGNLRALAPTEEASVSFLVNGDPDKKYTHYVKVKERVIYDTPVTGITYKQVSKNSVKVSWNKHPKDKGNCYYTVGDMPVGENTPNFLDETSGTSVTIPLSEGRTYNIVVYCFSDKDKVNTDYSTPIAVKLDPNWSGTVEPDPIETPDPAPTISKVSTPTVAKDSYKSVKVSWKKASNVDGYQIYRSKSKSTGYTKLATTSSTSKVVSANVGQGYYYKVRAYKKQNGKTYYGSFSSPRGYRNYMSKPSFSVSSPSKKKAKATWKKVSGASGYYVQFASNSSFTKSLKKVKVNSSKLSATISGVSSGKYQYVRVSCYKTINGKKVYSKWSSAKSIKVK